MGDRDALLDLNYGVGERIQIKYELPWVLAHEDGATTSGLGNSLVGVKWRFLDQEQAGLDISAYPQFEFDHHDSSAALRLADGGWSALLPFEFQRKLGKLTAFAETGLVWNQRRADVWIYGLAVEFELNARVSIFGELHGEDEIRAPEDHLIFNLGFAWRFADRISLLGSAGRSLHDSGGERLDLLSYLGVQFKF